MYTNKPKWRHKEM